MKIIHQQWQLIGKILIVDEDENAIVLGKDAQGVDTKTGEIVINIDRFRGNEVADAYQRARAACNDTLARFERAATEAADALVDALAQLSQSEPAEGSDGGSVS